MTGDEIFRRFLAECPGRGRWHRPVVERIEIAAGGKNIEPAARRSPRRPWRDELPIERLEQVRDFALPRCAQGRTNGRLDPGDDLLRARPNARMSIDAFGCQHLEPLDRIPLRPPDI